MARGSDQSAGPVLLSFPKRPEPLCPENNYEIWKIRGIQTSFLVGQEMLKGFSEINKKVLCLSPESVEGVSVGTGSGELQRPIHLQPLSRQVEGWDWGEAS